MICIRVLCRSNLQDLDKITSRLRERLQVNDAGADETPVDSEAMPLSTSSMLITYGSTLTGETATWGTRSVGFVPMKAAESANAVSMNQLEMDPLASTAGSATTDEAMVQAMKQTLERTGSTVQNRTLGETWSSSALEFGGEGSGGGGVLEHCDATTLNRRKSGGGSDIAHYEDSLHRAQTLLKELNPLVSGKSAADVRRTVPMNSNLPPPAIEFDFSYHHIESADDIRRREAEGVLNDDDDGMEEEEDTFANIWAMRQSQRISSGEDSINSTVASQRDDESNYVLPTALNDVSSMTLHDQVKPLSIKLSGDVQNDEGNSSDTWFVDPLDLREAASGGGVSRPTSRSVHATGDTLNQIVSLEGVPPLNGLKSDALPEFNEQDGDDEIDLFRQPWPKSQRKSAMQRRELMNQQIGSSSSPSEDETGSMMSRSRRRQRSNRDRAPQEQLAQPAYNHVVKDHEGDAAAAAAMRFQQQSPTASSKKSSEKYNLVVNYDMTDEDGDDKSRQNDFKEVPDDQRSGTNCTDSEPADHEDSGDVVYSKSYLLHYQTKIII